MNEGAPASGVESSAARAPAMIPVPSGMLRGSPVPRFLLARTPVTNALYAPFLAAGLAPAPPWWNDRAFISPRQPVVGVTWEEAVMYCDWLSAAIGGRWRLPTEAEWEFAACGGLEHPATAWGDSVPPGEIPDGPLDAPWEAGRGRPNGYGLYDMGSIVHEWCAEWRETERLDLPKRRSSR